MIWGAEYFAISSSPLREAYFAMLLVSNVQWTSCRLSFDKDSDGRSVCSEDARVAIVAYLKNEGALPVEI